MTLESTLIRLLALFAGLPLVSLGLLLRENEEGKLQNRLEEAWIRAEDFQRKALSRQAIFLSNAASVARNSLDRVFGEATFSFARVRSIFLLSSASMVFAFVPPFWHNASVRVLLVLLGLLLTVIGILPAIISKKSATIVTSITIVLICTTAALSIRAFSSENWSITRSLLMFFGISFSILSDIAFISFTRWLLKRIKNSASAVTMALGFLSAIAIAFAVVAPILFDIYVRRPRSNGNFSAQLQLVLEFVSFTSYLDVLCVSFVCFVCAVYIVHRALWPIIERSMYTIQRHGFLKLKKPVALVGLYSLLYALSPQHASLARLFDFFKKLFP